MTSIDYNLMEQCWFKFKKKSFLSWSNFNFNSFDFDFW